MKTLVLKENTKDIRTKIRQAGIKVCVCAMFQDAVWLDYSGINGVHGLGYDDFGMPVEEVLDRFMKECKEPVFCKNVDEFIEQIKTYNSNN